MWLVRWSSCKTDNKNFWHKWNSSYKIRCFDELDEIKMCIAYELNGKKIDYLPAALMIN